MNGDISQRCDLAVAFTANDPRALPLLAALEERSTVIDVPFDRIDGLTKLVAGALSFRPNSAEWWTMYQMHPLVARRRRTVLQQELARHRGRFDGLVMWGSWFHPHLNERGVRTPFVQYIDQSVALQPILGETHPGFLDRRVAHRQQASSYRDAAAVLCMSHWCRDQTLLAHPHLDPTKVRAVGWGPCGIDLSAQTLTWAEREPLVLHVSNDFHRKGLDYLVETARRVRETVPNARFVVIGQDYGGMKVLRQDEGVTFTGRISDRSVLESYFRRASVFFLPHRFDRSPHVLVEAMSAGLPIVTSSQGGPVELVDGTGAGIAVRSGDVEGYTAAITALLQNHEMAVRMGDDGKRLMVRSYTWAAVATKILDVLRAEKDAANRESATAGVARVIPSDSNSRTSQRRGETRQIF